MNRSLRLVAVTIGLLAALIMRAAIPAGYMPGQAGSGLLFEMCPTAVPAHVLAAMSGSGHAHHHGGETDRSNFDTEHCPIGHLLSVAVAVDISYPVDEVPATVGPEIAIVQLRGSHAPLNPRSRSPPA